MQRGHLIKKDNGRYGIIVTELTSGEPVQIFIDGKLLDGRIEHKGNDYCFIDKNNNIHKLNDGMEVLFD
ncbi:MAG: DUF5348 domain-containing protein [Paraclostridium sp.]